MSYHFEKTAGKSVAFAVMAMMVATALFVVSPSLVARGEGATGPQVPLFAGGDGSIGDPYQISTVEELQNMNLDLAANYILINDIDASATSAWNGGEGFDPIGDLTTPFAGTLDGQGFAIGNLFIDRAVEDQIGLFGRIVAPSTLSNVFVSNVDITGNEDVGGLVGQSTGQIMRCSSSGSVTGTSLIGGFIGWQEGGGLIQYCYSTASATGTTQMIGGFVGTNEGTITHCYSEGNAAGPQWVGGFVGFNAALTQNCYSTGTATGSVDVGGFVGMDFLVTSIDCYWDMDTSGNIGSDGGTGKTTAEMMQQATFAGWDFAVPGAWMMAGYPHLQAEHVYDIENVVQLQLMGVDLAGAYTLANDIDAGETAIWNGGAGFDPIGDGTVQFTGVFDGQENVIFNLHVNRPGESLAGLFGYINSPSVIINTGIEDCSVTGFSEVGALFGRSYGDTVTNCYTTGTVTGFSDLVGGFAGVIDLTTVSNCYSRASATSSGIFVSGFIGFNGAHIENCYSTGHAAGADWVGGFVGFSFGTDSGCYWDVDASGNLASVGGTGKTTAEMMQQATFAGWDFATVWSIAESMSYPFLFDYIDPVVTLDAPVNDENVAGLYDFTYSGWSEDVISVEFLYPEDIPEKTTQISYTTVHVDNGVSVSNGGIAWALSDPGFGQGDIYYWDGSTVIQVTDNEIDEDTPSLYDGTIAWAANDGNDYEIYYWDGTTTIQVSDNSYNDFAPSLYDGTIAWVSMEPTDSEILYWDGTTIIAVTDNGYNDASPCLYDGAIAWTDYNEIYYWDGATIAQITNNAIKDSKPSLYDGKIAWQVGDIFPPGNEEIYYWDGAVISQITSNSVSDVDPCLYDGKIVWSQNGEIAYWDGVTTITIPTTPYGGGYPSIEGGMIAFQASDGSDNEVFLYEFPRTEFTSMGFDATIDGSFEFDTTLIPCGVYDFYVNVTDAAGNTGFDSVSNVLVLPPPYAFDGISLEVTDLLAPLGNFNVVRHAGSTGLAGGVDGWWEATTDMNNGDFVMDMTFEVLPGDLPGLFNIGTLLPYYDNGGGWTLETGTGVDYDYANGLVTLRGLDHFTDFTLGGGLTLDVYDITDDLVATGAQYNGMLELVFDNPGAPDVLDMLVLTASCTNDDDVSSLTLFLDDGDGLFDPNADSPVDTVAGFTGGLASFSNNVAIGTGTTRLFVSADMAVGATDGNTVDLYLDVGDAVLLTAGTNDDAEDPAGASTIVAVSGGGLYTPYSIFGFVTYEDGSAYVGSLYVNDTTTGQSLTTVTDGTGRYTVDAADFLGGYADGDVILAQVPVAEEFRNGLGTVDTSGAGVLRIDVTLASTPYSSLTIVPDYNNTGTWDIDYAVTDPGVSSGIDYVELWYSYETGAFVFYDVDSVGALAFSFVAPDGEGNYTFYTVAYDNYGLSESAPMIYDDKVVYDASAPAVTLAIVPAYNNTGSWNIEYTVDDSNGGIEVSGETNMSLYLSFDGGADELVGWQTDAGIVYSFSWSDVAYGEGSYAFYVAGTDRAGNTQISATDTVFYDATAPEWTIEFVISDDADSNGLVSVGDTLQFTIEVTDLTYSANPSDLVINIDGTMNHFPYLDNPVLSLATVDGGLTWTFDYVVDGDPFTIMDVDVNISDLAGNYLLRNGNATFYIDGGGVDIAFVFGWNLWSLPVAGARYDPGTGLEAFDEAADFENFADAMVVSKWNPITKKYVNYIIGFHTPADPENFVINEQEGYFAWFDAPANLTVYGDLPASNAIPVRPGWNLISWNSPFLGDAGTDIADDVKAGLVDHVAGYNSTMHDFSDVYIFPADVLVLSPGRGYFVWSDTSATVTYDP